MRLHAMFWFIDRWRSSTAYTDMSLEEQGAYRNLLDEAQIRGGVIPDEERILEKACGDVRAWKRVRTAVLARFTLTADGWRNETLDKVLAESVLRAEKQRRYRNKAGNVTQSPSPSPSPSLNHKEQERASRAAFDRKRTASNPTYANMKAWTAECHELHADSCHNQRQHVDKVRKAIAS